MGVGGQHHSPAASPPGETRYPFDGPQGRSGRVRKISPPTGIRSPDRPFIASRYSDYAIPAHPISDITLSLSMYIYICMYIYIYIPIIIFHENPFSCFSGHFNERDRRAELNMYSGRKPTG